MGYKSGVILVGFAICSYLKTQGPLVASLGLSLLLRSLTTERRRSSLKSLLPDGENLGFSRQTPVFPGFAGVLETRQNPGKQGVNRRNTQEIRRCNPAETGRVIGKTRVNPGMGKPKPPLSYPGQEHTGACRPAQQGARNTQAPANGAYEGSHSTVPATGRKPPPPIWQALIWQAQNDWRQQAKFV